MYDFHKHEQRFDLGSEQCDPKLNALFESIADTHDITLIDAMLGCLKDVRKVLVKEMDASIELAEQQ